MAMFSSAIDTFKSLISFGSDKDFDPDGPSQAFAFPCPVCDQKMTLRDVKQIEKFGLQDVRLHALRCEGCGMIADRVYHPAIGYDHSFVV